MSSLRRKAKTLSELLWENRLEWDKWLCMGVTEQKQVELAPKYQEKWVRLEDVKEKAIALYRYYYEKSERHYGCFALGKLFDVYVLDEWNEPIEPKKFEELLRDVLKDETRR